MKMRFFLLLAVLTSSCASPLITQHQIKEPSEYCGLLHVPEPILLYEPKTFLGIVLSPVRIEDAGLPYDCNTFIRVESVMKDTPAMKTGIREKDIILSVNNAPVCRDSEKAEDAFRKMIEGQKAGSVARLEVMRSKEILILNAELGEKPYYHQHEAEYKFAQECTEQPSLLETTLKDKGSDRMFDAVIKGLNMESDTIHNPAWHGRGLFNPFQLREMTYMLRHPLQAGETGKAISARLSGLTNKEDWGALEIVRRLAGLLDIDIKDFSTDAELTLPNLIKAVVEANARVEHALSRLSPEERSLLREKALNPWEDKQWNDLLELSLKIDLKELFEAFVPVLHFMSNTNLTALKQDLLRRFAENRNPVLFEDVTPAGKIIVGGNGPNLYTEDYALILDLGGDDIYLNNAAGTRPGINTAVVIDWEGDDVYISDSSFSQAAGLLGGGFILDLSGRDIFNALDGSQGTGFFGLGLLIHKGSSSSFISREFSQGTGQLGIGFLWNSSDNDVYECQGYGQALGFFRGAGVLIDSKGNDYYRLGGLEPDFRDPLKATVSMGQGFGRGIRPDRERNGVSGGIGILLDKEGDDTYIADYFAQGASYYFGAGILYDMAGNDRYISGRYAQGAGIHSSAGVLIDEQGNDFYHASFGVAQGMGHDYGVGFFEDSKGDDRYTGGVLVQGAATHGGIGIITDLKGKDGYTCTDRCQAFAQDEDCAGIMMDTESYNDSANRHSEPEPVRINTKKDSAKK